MYFHPRGLTKKALYSMQTFRGQYVNKDLNAVCFLIFIQHFRFVLIRESRSLCLVLDALLETWGSVIDRIVSSIFGFKISEAIGIIDITEKIVFLVPKSMLPPIKAYSKGPYNGKDYPKHFMSPRVKGYTSVMIQKLTSGTENVN